MYSNTLVLNKSFYFIYEAILFHEEVRGQNFKRCRLYNIQSDVDYTTYKAM